MYWFYQVVCTWNGHAYLRNFILEQVKKYYSPYDIQILAGKGNGILDRRTVFEAGSNVNEYGYTWLYYSKVWANDIADIRGKIRGDGR